MNAIELVAGVVIITGAAAAIVIAPLQKSKPQPEAKPPVETVVEFQAAKTMRAEPQGAQQQEVDALTREIADERKVLQDIKAALKERRDGEGGGKK